MNLPKQDSSVKKRECMRKYISYVPKICLHHMDKEGIKKAVYISCYSILCGIWEHKGESFSW